jgi:phosphoenolpyruvate carboxykinase (GTP)
MTLAPDALGDRYYVEFYGDDIAWIWVDEDGVLRGFNPENGVFGVAKDTNEKTNPTAIASIGPNTGAIFTNVAYNEKTQEVWWEGCGPQPTAADPDFDGWLDWKGKRIAERTGEEVGDPWAHPNSRFTTQLGNVPNVAADWDDPRGVEIHGIIFGGRTRDREPLIRAITDIAEGVYDGLTLGAEATAAADGLEGVLRYDPMSMRPFMSYPEADYARHWLDVIGAARNQPIFAHVNWFQRGEDGRFLWPGYRENLRPLVWLMQLKNGEVTGVQSPVGVLPARDELNLDGLDEQALADLDAVLTIDVPRWRQEMGYRERHLDQFEGLPAEIWEAHRRVAAALHEAAD